METMPNTSQRREDNPTAGQAPPASGAIITTSQFLVFDPGLFLVEMAAPGSVATDLGLRLPAIRLDAMPATTGLPGRVVVTGAIESGWVWRADGQVFILVTGGRAGMMVSIFRPDGVAPAPEIRFRQIKTSIGGEPNPAPAPELVDPDVVPLSVLAHVRGTGDISGIGGRWLGRTGGNQPVEGFAITPTASLSPSDLEYQAIMGTNWNTPWFTGGEFCGSRGMLLPLLGYRIRLKGAAAEAFECSYIGSFVGQPDTVACKDGDPCVSGDSPLEALHIVVSKRVTKSGLAETAKADHKPTPVKASNATSKPLAKSSQQPSGKTQAKGKPRKA